MTAKILAFAGSLRKGSFNKKWLTPAVEGAQTAGAQVTLIDLKEFPMPIYDGDYEEQQGQPQEAKRLKQLFLEHDGLLIASPEYNSSISAALKNAIDWISRPQEGEEYLIAFKNKVAALMSASPSYFGGLRGLVHLRSILSNIGVLVLSEQLTLANADKAFDSSSQLLNEAKTKQARELGAKLAHTTQSLLKL